MLVGLKSGELSELCAVGGVRADQARRPEVESPVLPGTGCRRTLEKRLASEGRAPWRDGPRGLPSKRDVCKGNCIGTGQLGGRLP